MLKKANIHIKLHPEATSTSINEIESRIKKESKIPFCTEIQEVTIDDPEDSYVNLKKQGVSSNVARNLVDLYTNK